MTDLHTHYCRQCRAPWEHDGDRLIVGESLRAAHRCPSCGTEGWVKFYGNETHDEMCELETLCEMSEDERVPETQRRQAGRDFRQMAARLHRPNEAPGVGEWSLKPPYDDPLGLSLKDLFDALDDLER